MLLTLQLLNKGSFLSSLINKCRQVVRIKPDKKLEINSNPNIPTSMKTTPTTIATITSPAPSIPSTQQTHRPATANFSLSRSSHASKNLEEKVGLPPPPKRPLTPFFRYMNEQRHKLKASNPELSFIESVKNMSKKWETEDTSIKQRLQQEYRKDQQKYVEARTKYDSLITDEQRYQLKEMKQELIQAKERRMMRKRVKDLGRPKKPASSFLRFLAKERISTPQSPKETFRQWQQKIATKWSEMSDEEKSPYLKEARGELLKYREEISLWEEKMIRSGNIDVVRHINLIDPVEHKSKKA